MTQSPSAATPSAARPWRVAWQDALYGEDGFYRRAEGPAGHFETSANAEGGVVQVLAGAIATLARAHDCRQIVDVGAGRGELLQMLGGSGLSLLGVDVVDRPPGLADEIGWRRSPGGAALPAELADLTGTLVLAHEWLDVVPCDVLEVDRQGRPRIVEVGRDGEERLGEPAGAEALAWCERWWPLAGRPPGTRAEVGLERDRAWRDLLDRVISGVVVAVDYGHVGRERPAGGTLTGYRDGRVVTPAPDGSMDLTAHVTWDSLAGPDRIDGLAGIDGIDGTAPVVRPQGQVLAELGVDATRPPLERATGPGALSYLRDLRRSAAAQTLLDPDGLGGLGWLVHAKVVR